ncbi:hypothetical protein [Leucobacter sp. wl10]|uniref:hypothetical protein n=1 Tax=Leucobacter sp. wl10 TaxID=2304677 RepID=UPI001F09CCA4|nr:hypothetical protein [Leucobacter sp. wl10]
MGGVLLATVVLIVALVFFSMNDAVLPSVFTEMFGTRSRYLGFALLFNVGTMLFGGEAAARQHKRSRGAGALRHRTGEADRRSERHYGLRDRVADAPALHRQRRDRDPLRR